LGDAKLQGANLGSANLQGADLSRANLQGARLDWAKLQGANLQSANLRGASLWGAKLQGADLFRAELQGAKIKEAHLQGAYLQEADLYGVHLEYGDLSMADLRKVSFTPLDEEAWRSIRDIISTVPEGRGRLRHWAVMRIIGAMKRKTSIRPSTAEDVLYNPAQPEFADWAKRWTRPSGEDDLRKVGERIDGFLVSLSCKNQHVAKGIARRLVRGRDRTGARALLKKRDAVQAKLEECEGLKRISEWTWTNLRKLAASS
jgi:hypothetical protein